MICHNPKAAERDKHTRARLVAQLAELIDGSDQLSDFKRGELHGKIAGESGLNRYLRTTPAGKLRIDHVDGTWQNIRCELDRLHVDTFTGPAGIFQKVTIPTSTQKDLFTKPAIPAPPRSPTCSPHPADQHEHHALEKRPASMPGNISPAQQAKTRLQHPELRGTRGRQAHRLPESVIPCPT